MKDPEHLMCPCCYITYNGSSIDACVLQTYFTDKQVNICVECGHLSVLENNRLRHMAGGEWKKLSPAARFEITYHLAVLAIIKAKL